MMKKDLWLIIFFYAVLLAGCTYAFSTFFPSTIKPINKSVELNETQNNNGITLTLYRVSYNHDWQNQYISVTFKIENHGDFPATLNGSKDLNSTNNILLLKNTKEHFPLVGYSWMDDLGKEEDNGITYSFPARNESYFDLSFAADDKSLNGLECHIPLFINNEKVEFIFPIPSPGQIED